MEEVVNEEELVTTLVQQFLKHRDAEVKESGENANDIEIDMNNEATPRDELPPVLMHKLRKVYPSLGGLPPKIALESLDLHVPNGQVLGLLGKNGAGECRVLICFCRYGDDRARPSMVSFVFLHCSHF
jgi:ABC-type glutathione transport system ATPase component